MTDLNVLQSGLAEELGRIAATAAAERIAPDVLFNAVSRVLTRAHIQAAMAGRQAVIEGPIQGAISRVLDIFAPLRGGLHGQLVSELRYLAEFIKEISSGTLTSGQIAVRFQLYVEHLQATYWGAQTTTQERTGMTEERRMLTAQESCDDCRRYEGMGWQPIGSLPEPGIGSACQARCRCVKDYR